MKIFQKIIIIIIIMLKNIKIIFYEKNLLNLISVNFFYEKQ